MQKLPGIGYSRICTDLSCRLKPVPWQAGAEAPPSPELDDNHWNFTEGSRICFLSFKVSQFFFSSVS